MQKRRKYYNELELPDDEICRRYKAGETAAGLGREFGTSTDTILRRLRRHNVDVRHSASPICVVLREHKEALKDDPERMSGEFIMWMSRRVERKDSRQPVAT